MNREAIALAMSSVYCFALSMLYVIDALRVRVVADEMYRVPSVIM